MNKDKLDIARQNLFELTGCGFNTIDDIGFAVYLKIDDDIFDILNKNKIPFVVRGDLPRIKKISIDVWDAYNYKSNLRNDKINSILE